MRMRSVVTAAAIAAGALPGLAWAQASSADPVRFGVLAGFNSSTVGGKDAEDPDRRTGFVGGISLLLPFGGGWGIRPEVLYSQKGAKYPLGSEEGFPGKATVKLDYIDVPVLLQYEARTEGGIRPQVYAGPSVGFKARCKVEGSAGGASVSMDCGDADVDIKSADFAGVVGGGLAFPVGDHFAAVGVRYQHGFTDLTSDATVKNRVISVYAGFDFSMKR